MPVYVSGPVKKGRHPEVVQRRGMSILIRQRSVHPKPDDGHYVD
jgi:hypothetical protein